MMMRQWVVMMGIWGILSGVLMAQGGASELSTDYEEFKRYEAFRQSQLEALEKQRQAGAKAEFDDFQLFKQYRALRQQSATSPSSPSPIPVAPSGVNPAGVNPAGVNPAGVNPVGVNPVGVNPAGTGPSGIDPLGTAPPAPQVTPLKEAAQALQEAYRRYQSLKAIETARPPKLNADAPVSFGWDWVTTLGGSGLSYKKGPVSRELGGLTLGFGGRFSLPLGSNTSFLVGPEVWYTGVTVKGESPVFITTNDATMELKQSFFFLKVPVQFQQRMGPLYLAIGAYASRPLMANETKTNYYRWDEKKDIAPYLREWSFGSDISVTVALRDVQVGVVVHMPFTGFLKEGTAYQDSRLTTYALQVAARL